MAEKYVGVKFKIFLNKYRLRSSKTKFLIKVLRKLKAFMPVDKYGKHGNLSMRFRNGFIITPTNKLIEEVKPIDFVYVRRCDINRNEVYASGINLPSSESLMHWIIYEKRSDINFVFHGHSDSIIKKGKLLGFAITKKELAYGSIELALEVGRLIIDNDFVILKGHGFVVVGSVINDIFKFINQVVKYIDYGAVAEQ
ncbi:MAG: class II aldolase/adducin family protein [bacterium]|nr:class II aldolase/adducin family protein [bacterium]